MCVCGGGGGVRSGVRKGGRLFGQRGGWRLVSSDSSHTATTRKTKTTYGGVQPSLRSPYYPDMGVLVKEGRGLCSPDIAGGRRDGRLHKTRTDATAIPHGRTWAALFSWTSPEAGASQAGGVDTTFIQTLPQFRIGAQ